MDAIMQTGGQQPEVAPGEVIQIERPALERASAVAEARENPGDCG